MEDTENEMWRFRGSSIIFDRGILGELLACAEPASLRAALGWLKNPPREAFMPQTIVVNGLQAALEVMSAEEGNAFLMARMQALLRHLQSIWPNRAIVFHFDSPGAFEVMGPEEELYLRRRDDAMTRLGVGLWGGSALTDGRRIVRRGKSGGKVETIGYYVARI